MGCAECYNVFYDKLLPSLNRIHGKASYAGSKPEGNNSAESRLEELKKALSMAIEEQNFELAATLRDKINDIISQVKQEFANSTIELAIMLYRDLYDQYVTKYSDFNTDIVAQQSFLSVQYADGGGDFPEAVDTAMLEAASKQWSEKAKTKIF